MESNGYFPVGTKWDESVVNAARALMGAAEKSQSRRQVFPCGQDATGR